MTWNFFSFFLSNEEGFLSLELNTNIFETNIVNLAILFSILVYGYKSSFGPSLKNKQKEIIQTIENAQTDVVRALKYYLIAERGFKRSLFSLNTWKTTYQAEKTSFVENKYAVVKKGFIESFSTTESLIKNFVLPFCATFLSSGQCQLDVDSMMICVVNPKIHRRGQFMTTLC